MGQLPVCTHCADFVAADRLDVLFEIGANDGKASSVWMSVRRRARRGYLQEHCYHLVPVSQPAVLQV